MFNYKLTQHSPLFITLRVVLLIGVVVAFALCSAVDMSEHEKTFQKTVSEARAKLTKAIWVEIKKAKDQPEKLQLYKLLLKYDPENGVAKEVLAAAGEPTTVIPTDLLNTPVVTSALAQKVAKGYAAEKITVKDWESFPGEVITIKAENKVVFKLPYKKGEQYIILPNPEDKWAESTPGAPAYTYVGNLSGPTGDSLSLRWVIENPDKVGDTTKSPVFKEYIATAEFDGTLFINTNFEGRGTIKVKVCKVEK